MVGLKLFRAATTATTAAAATACSRYRSPLAWPSGR